MECGADFWDDVRECLLHTGVNGIMSSEAVLEYPPPYLLNQVRLRCRVRGSDPPGSIWPGSTCTSVKSILQRRAARAVALSVTGLIYIECYTWISKARMSLGIWLCMPKNPMYCTLRVTLFKNNRRLIIMPYKMRGYRGICDTGWLPTMVYPSFLPEYF